MYGKENRVIIYKYSKLCISMVPPGKGTFMNWETTQSLSASFYPFSHICFLNKIKKLVNDEYDMFPSLEENLHT